VSTQSFAVEFDRRTVGIAVRVPGGFMFYSSDRRFAGLDGRLFRRARAIERQLERIADRQVRAQTPSRQGHWAVAAMPAGGVQ
jgi:hypothetical protein